MTATVSPTIAPAPGPSVPCVLTATADEFGAEIPVGLFAIVGVVRPVVRYQTVYGRRDTP